jgi:hypothetical protein
LDIALRNKQVINWVDDLRIDFLKSLKLLLPVETLQVDNQVPRHAIVADLLRRLLEILTRFTEELIKWCFHEAKRDHLLNVRNLVKLVLRELERHH